MEPPAIGNKIHYYKRLPSTQDLAVSMAESDSQILNGTVVMAESQDCGRGSQNRRWASPPGGLWLSIILKPMLHANRSALINFITILAICEAIETKTRLQCKVKWPNDILVNNKKVCGIIVDAALKGNYIYYSVVGIGINVNVDIQTITECLETDQKKDSITSLKSERSGRFVNRRSLLKIIFKRLNYYINSFEFDIDSIRILRNMTQRLEGIGKTLFIDKSDCPTTGQLIGICSEGSLILSKVDGSIAKIFGQGISI
jgi:BirA family transcriptional regulator, biotin operon repressor / biotin---[acetyl-CoA-carboxylase] ligase